MKSYWRKLNISVIIVLSLVIIAAIGYHSGLTGLAGASVCGDGICAVDESYQNCPADCGPVVSLFVIPAYIWVILAGLIVAVIVEAGFIVTRIPHSAEERMEEYLTTEVSEGHPHAAVQERLVRKGWPHEEVHKEFDDFRIQKLSEYVQRQIDRGVSEKEVKKALLDVGWKAKDVKTAFKAAGFNWEKHIEKVGKK